MAQSDLVPKPWPEAFVERLPGKFEEIKFRLSNAIFDGTLDADITNNDFGRDINLKVWMQRDAYNNYLFDSSWTVVDRIILRPRWKILRIADGQNDYAAPVIGNMYAFAGGILTTEGTFEWRDVRVLAPGEAQNLPRIEVENKIDELNRLVRKKNTNQTQEPTLETDVDDINPYLNGGPLNSSIAVKLKKILNPFTLPVRMPMTRGSVKRMRDGEILSYSISGTLTFGAHFGWKLLLGSPRFPLGPELNLEARFTDNFQVSVKRETARFAQVRVSNIKPQKGLRNKAYAAEAKIGLDLNHVFNGIFLFKGSSHEIHTLQQSLHINPIRFSYAHSPSVEINAIYRYDLETLEGKDAFHHAVLGNLKLSDEIAEKQKGYAFPAVTFISHQDADRTVNSSQVSSDVSVLFSYRKSNNMDGMTAEIKTPEGTRKLFRSIAEKRHDSNNIKGNSEHISRKISVFMDEDGFKQNLPGSVLILSENSIEDSSTDAKQLNNYTHEVSTLLDEPNLFPIFPDRVPKNNDPKKTKKAWYGHSSFYFGFTVEEEEIQNFMTKDPEAIMKAAQKRGLGFSLADLLQLRRAYDKKDIKTLTDTFEKMFQVREKIPDAMGFFTDLIPKDHYKKFLVAQNISFGNIQIRGHKLSDIENSFARVANELGMTSDTYRTVADPNAIVTNLGKITTPDGLIKITFELANDPMFLFFRMDPLTRKDKDHKPINFVVFNRDLRFKKGKNELILDPKIPNDPIIRRLSQDLHYNEYLNLTMGYSQKGADWGYGASTQFLVPNTYQAPHPTKNGETDHRK